MCPSSFPRKGESMCPSSFPRKRESMCPSSFPRKRESMLSISERDDSTKWVGSRWIPAFAGMTMDRGDDDGPRG